MSCILETERLLLRPPERRDIPALVPLANNYDVAKNLSKLPHPHTEKHGEEFVGDGIAFVMIEKHPIAAQLDRQ